MKNILLTLLLLVTTLSFSQETDYAKIPQLQTKTTFTTEVSPDKIVLSIVLSENNTRGKVSLEELEKRLQLVLKQNKIDLKKQLTLTDLSSNFQDYFLKKTDVQKTKNYHLQLGDAMTAGKVLRGLANQDISNVRLLKTEYSKIEELKIELRGKAVLKARKQAESMVKSLDQELGPAIYISDLETYFSGGYKSRAAGLNVANYSMESMESDLDVSFEKIRVDATVTVYFALK
ncbi:MAG: SIMPL domain-containing protein [Flavobacteriaceae bacterium]|nr:MAG: SIMPL domain-containing protein [Flavobacteriaceae bacterium]